MGKKKEMTMLLPLLLIATTFLSVSALTCPSCSRVEDVTLCSHKYEECYPTDDVCLGKLEEWRFSVMCSSSLLCPNELFHGTVNCTGGVAFRPHDECTSCCTGSDCQNMLNAVQTGFLVIPTVLHCPTCTDTRNVDECMKNIQPCDLTHDTCEIQMKQGRYTGKCQNSYKCEYQYHTHPGFPECFHDTSGECVICCHDEKCVKQAFGVLNTLTTPGTTYPKGCADSPFYPCKVSKQEICANDFLAINFCERTCNVGRCTVTDMTSSTPPTTTESSTCVDSDEFPCSTFHDICSDVELAKLNCPKMCNLC